MLKYLFNVSLFIAETPFGTMPVLFIDGKWLAQSGAINRYLAAKFNLLGDSDLSAAFCDMIWETVGEGYFKCVAFAFEPDAEKKVNYSLAFTCLYSPSGQPGMNRLKLAA